MAKVRLVEVRANTYLELRKKYPTAFMIQPSGQGYKAMIRERVNETNACRRD